MRHWIINYVHFFVQDHVRDHVQLKKMYAYPGGSCRFENVCTSKHFDLLGIW